MTVRREMEKMLAGELYWPGDPEIGAAQMATKVWLVQYNAQSAASPAERRAMLRERLAAVGDGAVIRPPFQCDYGFNITLGRGAFLNFNCVILDVVGVEIGAGAQIGPGVQIYAADHPRDPALRREELELGRRVKIGAFAWIGGGAIILPGVTVGEDAVVGAGSIVTRDVPAGATVAGNPARPLQKRRLRLKLDDNSPLPLAGEGEGGRTLGNNAGSPAKDPSPQPSPASGRGSNSALSGPNAGLPSQETA